MSRISQLSAFECNTNIDHQTCSRTTFQIVCFLSQARVYADNFMLNERHNDVKLCWFVRASVSSNSKHLYDFNLDISLHFRTETRNNDNILLFRLYRLETSDRYIVKLMISSIIDYIRTCDICDTHYMRCIRLLLHTLQQQINVYIYRLLQINR